MDTIEIKINNKKYEVLVARSEKEREQGLQNVIEMDDDEGCLFIHDEPESVSYWMHSTYIPLDIIFIDEDKEVISVKKGKPESEDEITEDNVKYVLELNKNSGVEPGDILEFDEDDEEDEDNKLEPNKMYVIGSDGEPQATLLGGERIISRTQSSVIIRKAKKANRTKDDADYKSLGKYMFYVLDKQEHQTPQYVDAKK